jgi:hypothetical protein
MGTIRYRLSRHSYLSVAIRYCVFLDAARDRYLAVNREEFTALGPWLEGWIGPEPDRDSAASLGPRSRQLAVELCRRGILTTSERDGKPVQMQAITPATRNAVPHFHRIGLSKRLGHGVNCLMAAARTRRQFKTDTFESIMRGVSASRARAGAALTVELQYEAYLVSVFEACRTFYSRPYICLFDSVSLLNFLARYGFFPSLVFGVIAEPFQAHCWLQDGDVVLNDAVERVTAYAPIMCI